MLNLKHCCLLQLNIFSPPSPKKSSLTLMEIHHFHKPLNKSLLAGESWNNCDIDLRTFPTSQPTASMPTLKVPWSTWRPHKPILIMVGCSFSSRYSKRNRSTFQLVEGPFIDNWIRRYGMSSFNDEIKKSHRFLAFGRYKKYEPRYLVHTFFWVLSQ